MKPSSAKAKGRRLQNQVAQMIRTRFGLPESDVKPAVMGESGADIKLSDAARQVFPFAVECKNRERINIWKALDQAESNGDSLAPAVVFSRNRDEIYIAMRFDTFLDLLEVVDDESN